MAYPSKEAVKVHNRRYYEKNQREILKQKAEYYKKNRLLILSQKRDYLLKGAKEINERRRVFYKKNKRLLLERMSRWRRNNRDKTRKLSRLYGKSDCGRYSNLTTRSKKLKVRGVRGVVMSLEQYRNALFYKTGIRRPCRYCLGETNVYGTGLDRINSDINYTLENTVSCCRGCNSWKGRRRSYKETMKHFKPMRDAARED